MGLRRGERLTDIPGTSGTIESGVVSAGNSSDSISNSTNVGISAGNSSIGTSTAVGSGLTELQRSIEKYRIFEDVVDRTIESSLEAERTYEAIRGDSSSAEEYAIRVAIEKAEALERIIKTLREASDNLKQDE